MTVKRKYKDFYILIAKRAFGKLKRIFHNFLKVFFWWNHGEIYKNRRHTFQLSFWNSIFKVGKRDVYPRLFFPMNAACKFFKIIIYFKMCGVFWMNKTNWFVFFLEFAYLLNDFFRTNYFRITNDWQLLRFSHPWNIELPYFF